MVRGEEKSEEVTGAPRSAKENKGLCCGTLEVLRKINSDEEETPKLKGNADPKQLRITYARL